MLSLRPAPLDSRGRVEKLRDRPFGKVRQNCRDGLGKF